MKNYGSTWKTLTRLLKKDAYEWSVTMIDAFNHLNKVMTNPFMLDLLDLNKVFVVETDALRMSMRVFLI
jgi:hypothetical protein